LLARRCRVQVIESVLPSQSVRTRGAGLGDGRFARAGAIAAALVVLVPLFAVGSVQLVLWLLGMWVEMAGTMPLLLAQ
jgi:hypothetical protein